mmetsp:Transcript_27408/g.58640  ORF Transcript_27408/g.58640 Transcript_27408/m.58640 type:complete len:94 (-) Transcript_27408:82-363(-)
MVDIMNIDHLIIRYQSHDDDHDDVVTHVHAIFARSISTAVSPSLELPTCGVNKTTTKRPFFSKSSCPSSSSSCCLSVHCGFVYGDAEIHGHGM